jgi:hypothetical protein
MSTNGGADRGETPKSGRFDDKKLNHLVYVAGITLLTGVVNFVFLWPVSHLGALLIFALWLSFIAIYELRNFPSALIVTVPVLFLSAFVVNYFVPPPADVEVVGTLEPGAQPTPPNGCDGTPLGLDALKILIGDNVVVLSGLGRVNAIKVGNCPVLSFERTAAGVSPIVDLYDAAGNKIAEVRNGGYHAFSGGAHFVDRRGDLSTLAITDSSGHELLFSRYLNPTALQARGIFGCPGHRPVVVKDSEPVPGISMTGACIVGFRTGFVIP